METTKTIIEFCPSCNSEVKLIVILDQFTPSNPNFPCPKCKKLFTLKTNLHSLFPSGKNLVGLDCIYAVDETGQLLSAEKVQFR